MRLLLILFVLTGTMTFAQQKPPVVYKQLSDTIFNLGDRIVVGEMQAPPDPDHRLEYLAILPNNIAAYRELIRQNPLITFKVHVLWSRKGAKFPAQTEAVYDSLYAYLNAPVGTDSTIRVKQLHHGFVKQNEHIKVELEIIGIAAKNQVRKPSAATIQGVIALPELNMIYRNYNNVATYAVSSEVDSVWIEGKGIHFSPSDKNRGVLRVTGTDRTVSATIKALSGKDTISCGTTTFRVSNLPKPTLYFGPEELENLAQQGDSAFFAQRLFFAKYPAQIPLRASFEIREVHYAFSDGRTYVQTGKRMPDDLLKMVESLSPGAVITITKIIVVGPEEFVYNQPVRVVKKAPKNASYPEKNVLRAID